MLRCNNRDLDKIKEYFEVSKFKKFLEDKFSNHGFIYNYYGRPICYNHSLVNYWIQSSAVDYCSFAFANLIKDYNLNPCFFVHDSMTCAVRKDLLENVINIKNVFDAYSNISIPVEICVLS